MKILALLSGGLDSTSMVADYLSKGNEVEAINIVYGQRHAQEIPRAQKIAEVLGIKLDVLDLRSYGASVTSALTTDSIEVPKERYREGESSTVVPGRNGLFAFAAAGIAASRGFDAVAMATHGGDHLVYADCRPSFNRAIDLATQEAVGVRVFTPFETTPKSGVVKIGHLAGAPLALSWSCYENGEIQCGTCASCIARHEAFLLAGIPDPTQYEVPPSNKE